MAGKRIQAEDREHSSKASLQLLDISLSLFLGIARIIQK